MNRRAGMVPVVALAVLMLFPPAQRRAREAAVTGPATPVGRLPEAPAVQLEHQLIRVPDVRRPRRAPAPRRNQSATKLATLRPAGTPLMARARRVLVGDGRYRPEPFPRVGR